jgi:hypothetical protein
VADLTDPRVVFELRLHARAETLARRSRPSTMRRRGRLMCLDIAGQIQNDHVRSGRVQLDGLSDYL